MAKGGGRGKRRKERPGDLLILPYQLFRNFCCHFGSLDVETAEPQPAFLAEQDRLFPVNVLVIAPWIGRDREAGLPGEHVTPSTVFRPEPKIFADS